ncbi:hypothetical protein CIB84_011121, partial [Bambusicola thoracicus]
EAQVTDAEISAVDTAAQNERLLKGLERNTDSRNTKSSGQAVLVDRTMYIAGQVGIEPSTGQLVSGGIKEETKQAFKNLGEILKAAGCDYSNVVKTTVFLADIKDFNDMNEIYGQCK